MQSVRLREIFSSFGTVVDATIMSSQLSGQSRGFGFVEMSSAEEAAACLSNLNGKEFDGQKLTIAEAPADLTKKRTRKKKS
jgi:RNA recognition motif-containing protein